MGHLQSSWFGIHAAITSAMLLMVSAIDYITGTEMRVYPLYFLPITYAASRMGRTGTNLTAIGSSLSWLMSNALSGLQYKSLFIWVWNTSTQALAFIFIGTLVYQLQASRRREHELSLRDSLTGLFNARGFHEHGEERLKLCRREGWPIVLAYIDLDNFKLVNDCEGHHRGDEVLRETAKAVLANERASDLISRLGGDEFAILFLRMDPDAAQACLDALRIAIALRMSLLGCAVTASIGAVAFRTAPATLDEAVREADEIMYSVKHAGRNHVIVRRGDMAPAQ